MSNLIVITLLVIGIIVEFTVMGMWIGYEKGIMVERQKWLDKYRWELNVNGISVLAPIEK